MELEVAAALDACDLLQFRECHRALIEGIQNPDTCRMTQSLEDFCPRFIEVRIIVPWQELSIDLDCGRI